MKSTSSMPPVFSHTAQVMFALIAMQFPATGYCDTGSGWVNNLFGSKGKNMKEVAVKVAELPEQYKINVHGLDFSPDGTYLAVDSADSTINIWDWRKERIVRTLEKVRSNDGLTTEPIRYSPDGRLLVACHGRSGGVVARIWDTETWAVAHDIVDLNYGSCSAVGFTSDGKSLIGVLFRIGTHPGDNLTIYDTSTWQPVWGLRTIPFYPQALSISPDGKLAAIGGWVRNPRTWPFSTQKPTFGTPPLPNMSLIAVVDMEQRSIARTIQNTVDFSFGRLAWSPDGNYITAMGPRAWDGSANIDAHGNAQGAFTSGLDTVMVFDAHTGKQIAGEQLEDIESTSLRYTPDGKYLIEGVMNGRGSGRGVRIWDGQHHELLQEIPGEVSSLAVSRDGHYFAMGEVGKTVVWQLK